MNTPGNGGTRGPGGDAQPGDVHVIVHGARTRVVLSGEIDADLGSQLSDAMSDAEATGLPVDVDAERVTFMDSSGIAFLARIATRTGERVRVIDPPESVRFLLEVTRIGELLDVVTGEAAARVPGPDALSDDVPDHGLPTIGLARRRHDGGPDDVA